MVATTSKAICVAARAKLATIPTSREATELFLPHETNHPFDDSTTRGVESFEVTETRKRLTSAFGVTGTKEEEFYMVVRLGHGPFGTDDTREDYISRDQDRIADILEAGAWAPAGTEAVWFEGATTDKSRPNWWITELVFRVVFASTIETA